MPNFYCLDVVKNIREHGYRVELYPLDNNFQIAPKRFMKLYRDMCPSVVILFAASGITSNLSENKAVIKKMTEHSLIISDYVHRIIDPQQVTFLSRRHIVIDSIRKNTPLPGSFVYLTQDLAQELEAPSLRTIPYVLLVSLRYLYYRTLLSIAAHLHNTSLVTYADVVALKAHDDLVGDSQLGNAGLPWVPHIHRHLNLKKIKRTKKSQVKTYLTLLNPLLSRIPGMEVPAIKESDLGELRALPLIATGKLAKKVERALTPLNVWAIFPDSPWSLNKRVFFLPLGFHIKPDDQRTIVDSLASLSQ